ncbi:lysozyme family protein [Flavicella marina]|uniref:peptidoglycan-binding protein LysM n=1 Tax=Flavicella marina TaxID=1475951 RepID=UPI001264D59A|nr:peptidoglycan-binding protein LysM [Flavicella marina]
MKSIKKKFFLSIVFTILLYSVGANEPFVKGSKLDQATFLSLPTKKTAKSTFTGPYNKNDFFHFKEALAFKESGGNYKAINSFGYLGKYQFGSGTLERFDIYNTQDFLQNPELQEKAFIALCQVNKWILRKDIRRSVGRKINGIVITESGILAAAHLAGAGNVKKFLRSNGDFHFEDGYGTSIEEYLYTFRGYDTSNIIKNRMPEVS